MPFMSQCRKRSFLDHFYKFGMVALLQGLSLLVLLSYAVPAIGQSGSQPVTATASPDQGLFTPLDEATSALLLEQTRRQGGTQVVARERFVTVNFVQLEQEATGQKVILNLFADVQLIADLVTRQRNPSGSYTWIGHLQGIPLSQAIFVVRDQALYGSIQALGIGEFANGGLIGAGNVGLVGEQGPEFITGPANITPMDKMSGSTAPNVNITINIYKVWF